MHFELDQARDIFIIHNATEGGIKNLPLLGPQARGRELYLGPIFYYFQYLSGIIWGVTPESMVYPDLLFSILAIPLFYFLARFFFGRLISLSLTTIVATSLFLVTYGRFAWNPNGMFFWSLLTFHGLLKSFYDGKFKSKWFLVFAFGLGIITQLHFIAFIAVPLTAFLYITITKMPIPWKTLVGAIAIILFLYTPVILSEIQTGGNNYKAFLISITQGEDDDEGATVKEKSKYAILDESFRFIQESSTFYWNIISADNNGRHNISIGENKKGELNIKCDKACQKALPHHLTAMLLLVLSLAVFMFDFIKLSYQKIKSEKGSINNSFNGYFLVGLWLFFGAIFLFLVVYQISPRFFLYLGVPFLIILGMLLEKIEKIKKAGRGLVIVVVVSLVGANLWMTGQYFQMLNEAQVTETPIVWEDIALNRNDIITLRQLRQAGLYLEALQTTQEQFIVVGDSRYARALYYLTSVENNHKDALCYMKSAGVSLENLKGVTYYALLRTKSGKQITPEMLENHKIEVQKSFGTIIIYKMVPNGKKQILETVPNKCFVS